MRLDGYFATAAMTSSATPTSQPWSLNHFTFGPMGTGLASHWAEIYRVAYERTIEALRPTRYDRAMQATAN
jgi:hypothetical protein